MLGDVVHFRTDRIAHLRVVHKGSLEVGRHRVLLGLQDIFGVTQVADRRELVLTVGHV